MIDSIDCLNLLRIAISESTAQIDKEQQSMADMSNAHATVKNAPETASPTPPSHGTVVLSDHFDLVAGRANAILGFCRMFDDLCGGEIASDADALVVAERYGGMLSQYDTDDALLRRSVGDILSIARTEWPFIRHSMNGLKPVTKSLLIGWGEALGKDTRWLDRFWRGGPAHLFTAGHSATQPASRRAATHAPGVIAQANTSLVMAMRHLDGLLEWLQTFAGTSIEADRSLKTVRLYIVRGIISDS